MSEVLRLLISLSLSGGVLTILTAVLNRLLRGRMPMGFLYALWILALLRFLCPLGTDGSLAHRAVSQPQMTVILTVSSQENPQPAEHIAPKPSPNAGPSGTSAPSLPILLTAVWAAGAVIAAGRRWGGYVHLKRRLRAEALPVAQWELDLLRTLTEGDRRAPRLMRSAAADTPMLAGLFRPVIWLPAGTWNQKELGYALRHELTHHRRHDLLLKWAAVGTACLHWFNPAAWYLVRAVERDGELSCDEAVARTLSPKERTGYGELLLHCAIGQADRAGRLAASLNTQKQDLKARLMIIMRKQPDPKKARLLLAAALVLLVTVSASVGAYAISAAPDSSADSVQTDIQIPDFVPEGEPEPFSDEWIAAVPAQPADEQMADGTDDADPPGAEDEDALLAWPIEIDSDGMSQVSLSNLFGRRTHPITGAVYEHNGIDIVLPQDTPVLAAAAGVVAESGFDNTLGFYVALDHGDGLSTLYAHMTGGDMPAEGDQVEAGEQIGAVGKTGMATGCHLHFEVRADGTLVEPLNYLPWNAVVTSFQSPE